MTPSDKAAIAGYMGWEIEFDYYVDHRIKKAINFDLNDAGLCVEKMVEKGDLEDFEYHVIHCHLSATGSMTQWLFNPENFFTAMSAWVRRAA